MADVMSTVRPGRTASVSSAGTTTSGTFSFIPRYTPRPEPAYISSVAAAEHVTHKHRHENYELLSPAASPTNDGAVFNDSALALLNAFLDSLLYNFLGKARGTSLVQLRPAILEVLKARLGREALASADEELHGLVGDDDSDLEDAHEVVPRPSSTTPEWHLESAFKRMRLRVMVFIRLGDFDDEDEDRFLEEDFGERGSQTHEFGFQSSPAPVYLASVLEYLAELTLSIAGDAAYARAKNRTRRIISENQLLTVPDYENVVVEDKDVEKIALNSTLGRLWRTWLKNYKGIITASPGRGYSRRGSLSSPTRVTNDNFRNSIRHDSTAGVIKEERESPVQEMPHPHEVPEVEPSETDIAANIPLPITDNDIDEIEIPGLAPVLYDEGEDIDEDNETEEVARPRSLSFIMPGSFLEQDAEFVEDEPIRPVLQRQRSISVPTAGVKPWGWMPASIQRALRILSSGSEDDILAYAASIPLPEDEEDVAAVVAQTESDSTHIKEDQHIDKDHNDVSAADTEESSELEPKHDEKASVGLIAGATALVTGAVALATASFRGSKHDSVPRHSLDVQTKEVFEPEDVEGPDSNRASKDQMPTVVTAAEEDISQPSQRVSKDISDSKRSSNDSKLADIEENPKGSKPTSNLAQKEMPNVYKPRSSPINRESADSTGTSSEKVPNNQVVPRSESKKSSVSSVSVYAPKRLTADSQQAKQILEQAAARPVDSPIKSASSFNAPSQTDDYSPVSPLEDTATSTQQQRMSPGREGPPKPLPMSAPNPYAMLYDDVEPGAIGVAKTSNVPIHSTTPSMSTEQRPWTPNRGVPSVMKSGSTAEKSNLEKQATAFGDRRSAPSPLRPIMSESETNGTREVPRTVVSQPDDYDLDRPINPERFHNWNRAKESPTLPRFFTQQSSTPTETEQRRGSLPHSVSSRHSPKGSQGSTGTKDKREDEVAKERKFEALLGNKEPVKYTLTPEEIRDSRPYPPNTEGRKAVPAPIDTNRASKQMSGAKSPSLFRKSQPPPSPKRPLKIKDIREAISALSPEPTEPKQRKSGLTAREARILGSDTKDFADWIRTTGPTSEQQVQPIVLSNRWSQPSSISSARGRSNLVPREAGARNNNTTDDLIDFLRSGPPDQPASSDHRAPRKVPVFRSTMDSEDLGALVNGGGQHSLVSRPSVTDSFNSNAPLLDKNRSIQSNPGKSLAPPAIQPPRTRRRAKDPYAIDSDDEDEFTALPDRSNFSKPSNQTENLQDFLRSTSPSAGPNGVASSPLNFRTPVNAVSRSQPGTERTRAVDAPLQNGSTPVSNRGPPQTANSAARMAAKMEARTAGATKGFNGHGYYYSTNDMADFLRSSGPDAQNGSAPGPRRTPSHVSGTSIGGSPMDVDRQGSKRVRAFWKRGVEAGA